MPHPYDLCILEGFPLSTHTHVLYVGIKYILVLKLECGGNGGLPLVCKKF